MKPAFRAEPGRVALSIAGRDKGRYLIIIKEIGQNYVEIVDGTLRKIDKPKRKKLKHLKLTPIVAQSILQDVQQEKLITNHDIKSRLQELGFQVEAISDKEEGAACQNRML